mmetsp:Transcript_34047/g.60594  ORF Transcript_34047/g.60594 Transcript_34047/m.60594 type:complete len:484 (+) Transcript_34047:92-1543(+)
MGSSFFKQHPGFIPACSNFSIQYNYASASIAAAIMLSHNDRTGFDVVPDYPQPRWVKSVLLGVVFIGSVVGMLTMGYLGDLLGIQRGLVITNWFIVIGSLASALLSWGSSEAIWSVIALSRFVLGIGVGGAYPLSAAKAAATGKATDDPQEAVNRAGKAFFWQGPGSMAPYVLAIPLLKLLPHNNGVTSLQFRLLLGLGALPAMVVLLASMAEGEASASQRGATPQQLRRQPKEQNLAEKLRNPEHMRALVGTAGGWFLFDIAFYGTIMFAPNILENIFEGGQTLTSTSLCAAIMAFVGIVGNVLGLAALPETGAKMLNVVGFSVSAVLFMLFVVCHLVFKDQHILLFALLCFLYVTLYAGPNIATFVLPVMAFPPDVRATYHGLSAAAAKLGAMVGTLLFPVLDDAYGVLPVMGLQAVFCTLGAIVSHCCLSDYKHEKLQQEDLEMKHPDAQRIGVGSDTSPLKENREENLTVAEENIIVSA